MSLFSRKTHEELALVFDIGSGSIGGAIALLSSNNTPKLLYTVRLPIMWQERPEAGAFLSSITHTIDNVCENLVRFGLTHIKGTSFGVRHLKNVYTIYSSPWYISQTKILTIDKKTPVIVTKNLIDSLIKEEERQFTESVSKGTHSHIFEHAEVIERGIIRTRLNGYDTPDPYNKKASLIETTFFMSFISKDILEITKKAIHRYFNYRHINSYSFPLVAFKAIAAANPNLNDFLLVDVRGEVTDLSLIKDNALLESISFPIGKNSLLRTVAEGTNSSVHIALSYLQMHVHNRGTPDHSAQIAPILEIFKKDWNRSYNDSIDEITRDVAAPKKIFLISDNEVEQLFEGFINDSARGLELHPLKRHELKKYIEMNTKFDDPFLALEAMYINSHILS